MHEEAFGIFLAISRIYIARAEIAKTCAAVRSG
jgi:hypothetical protein